MKTRAPSIPPLRQHKSTGQGYVLLNGRFIYLGRFDHPETRVKYERVLAEWLAAGRQLPTPQDQITVKELLARFLQWAKEYYTPTGTEPAYEIEKYKRAIGPLRKLYAECRAVEFGPLALQAVRQRMIEMGWCRKSVNSMVNRIKAIFRWGTAQELIPANVFHGLSSVTGLRFGRTAAPESEGIKPVPLAHVQAVMPYLSRTRRPSLCWYAIGRLKRIASPVSESFRTSEPSGATVICLAPAKFNRMRLGSAPGRTMKSYSSWPWLP